MQRFCASVLTGCLVATAGMAGEADVLGAEATRSGATWRFDVTVRHADEGWRHHADAWGIFAPDGTELGVRPLLHPHVDEQPFMRSLSGAPIPCGLDRVVIRAHDSLHGWGGAEVELRLP